MLRAVEQVLCTLGGSVLLAAGSRLLRRAALVAAPPPFDAEIVRRLQQEAIAANASAVLSLARHQGLGQRAARDDN